MSRRRIDRDGRQGWSRRSASAWERVFGPQRCSLHTFWNDEPACSECGYVWPTRAESFREKSAREA